MKVFNDGAGLYGLSGASYSNAIDSVNHRLFKADAGNNRVLVYDLNVSNQLVDKTPDYVLGQNTFYSNVATTTQSGMNTPTGLVYDAVNQRLFVSDTGNNRVTVFDITSITNGESAINVLGQSNFTSSEYVVTQSGMYNPRGLTYDSTNQRLFVGESENNRITIFSVTPLFVELSTSTATSTNESSADNFPKLIIYGTSTAPSTVELDITGGTATIVGDYTSSDPIVITIPPGVYDGTASTSVTITPPTIVQDSVVESGGETIIFSLINPDNVLVGDANFDTVTLSSFIYTILDSDIVVQAASTPLVTQSPIIDPMFSGTIANTPVQPQTIIQLGSSIVIKSDLSLGKTSSEVKIIQKLLNSDLQTQIAKKGVGSPGKETNYYGLATKVAVQKFQLKYGIVTSPRDTGYGVVGPKTRAKMNELLKRK